MIRFGILSFAHPHANEYATAINNIRDSGANAELLGIADEDRERGENRQKEFHIPYYFQDYRKMLESEIDAVVICSENASHVENVIAASQAGKHIICEKPIAISSAGIEEMRSALSGAKVFFQTAFVMRYSSSILQAKKTLANGVLGKIKAISGTNHGRYPGGWFGEQSLSGGGAIMDHTVHVADLVRFLTKDEFASVRAFRGKNIREGIAVEDNALVYCELNSGIPVSIDCSWSRHDGWPTWGDLTMELVCEKGVLKIDAFRPHMEIVSEDGKFQWHGFGEDLNEKMIRSFCASVEEKKETKASFKDGAGAASIAFSAYESIEKGSQRIRVP